MIMEHLGREGRVAAATNRERTLGDIFREFLVHETQHVSARSVFRIQIAFADIINTLDRRSVEQDLQRLWYCWRWTRDDLLVSCAR